MEKLITYANSIKKMHIDRLSFILLALLDEQASNTFRAMSIHEITRSEELQYKEITVYKHLKKFLDEGFVEYGLKDGKACTYYITDMGRNYLKNLKIKGGLES